MKRLFAFALLLSVSTFALAAAATSPQPLPDVPGAHELLRPPVLNPDDPLPQGFGRDNPSAPNPVIRRSPLEPRQTINPDDPIVPGPYIYPIPERRYARRTRPIVNPDDPMYDRGYNRVTDPIVNPDDPIGRDLPPFVGIQDGKSRPGEILPVIRPFFDDRIAIDFGPDFAGGPVRAELYDFGGRLVLKQTVSSPAGGILDPRLGSLAAGRYLLKLSCDCGPKEYASRILTKLAW